MTDFGGLPGAELVEKGLADLAAGEETVFALLVAIATHRLRAAGVDVPAHTVRDAELCLYRLLSRDHPAAAHSEYNALLRRLDSFASALEREQGKALRSSNARG